MKRGLTVLTVMLGAVVVAAIGVIARVDRTGAQETLTVEIAEIGMRFVPDETPVHEDGKPAYGGEFVTQGYIYPEGTLNGSNGVLADGSPEFPDKVLGQWTCRGWHVGDGAHTVTGPWVVTTQLYNFGEGYGEHTLVTNGYELADENVSVTRAITGGTGRYSMASGVQVQQLLGFNATEGVVLRVELRVQR